MEFYVKSFFVAPMDPDSDEPTYSVDFTQHIPIPLKTGKVGCRTRASHARAVRLARWKRRRQRRHGIPAATVYRRTYYPRARVTANA